MFKTARKLNMILALILLAIGLAGLAYYNFFTKPQILKQIDSFDKCVKAGFDVTGVNPKSCKTTDGRIFKSALIPNKQALFKGEVVCLPHKDKGEFQTLECAYGLKTEDGKYYAISDPEAKYVTAFSTSEKVLVEGSLAAPSVDSKYDIVGVISVSSMKGQDE